MSVDYRDTVFLPKTEFPMKAGLPKREPELLARWEETGLWQKLRDRSRGRERFILHDGPPYANGHLHIGHALNKILKDVINRSQQMMGKDAHYVPGWDCHGLPIEWKIEEQYRANGQDKDEVPIAEFRQECREFADHWIDVQRTEFKRLGVMGDWDAPYTTMAYDAEAQIAAEIGKFLMNGSLYKGAKPVLWSVVEKTALAEAEVEYKEKKSPTIFVRFPVLTASVPALEGAAVVIWTTTPWTIPGNRGVAVHPEFRYAVLRVEGTGEDALVRPGETFVIAEPLVDAFVAACGIETHSVAAHLSGSEVVGTVCTHPFRGQGYDFDVPVMAAEFVTDDQGTGFVHIAPGHGADDFLLGTEHGLEVPATVGEDGTFYNHVPLFAGARILTDDGKDGDANGRVIKALIEAGALCAKGSLRHSYPHSWRSKAPLIFRNTAQWFISMETNGLRDKALAAIEQTRFYPSGGKNRLRSMIETRPDWCISRQRAWGVPIPVFVQKETGEPLRDQAVVDRTVAAFREEGADAWFSSPPGRFLGNEYDPDDFEQVRDVVDVWFDSGSTHAFVLEGNKELAWPASLYLEGSDQHRGWFHSSLLEACGTRGHAPYEAALTHGFIMAEDGHKMSKSLGNSIEPQEVNDKYGAETLRLWVVASDYTEDLRFGPNILKQLVDGYRRLRNTLRFLLGNLNSFDPARRVDPADMPEPERWVLHRLWEMDRMVRHTCSEYAFHTLYTALYRFCDQDLSAFYFDIRKDSLYCDGADDPGRLATLTVLDEVFSCLTAWMAPILCFTAEEAWLARNGDRPDTSVHLRTFPEVPDAWRDDALAAKWAEIRAVRRVVLGAMEVERAEKRIGSSLQAAPRVHLSQALAETVEGVDLAEICITSAVEVSTDPAPETAFQLDDVPGVAVVPALAPGDKCERCWRVLPEVGTDPAVPGTCLRCAGVVAAMRPAAE